MPFLIVEKGTDKGAKVDLKAGAVVAFGRDATCQLPTGDQLCSRRHFEVLEQGGKWVMRDLGSVNGTYVNQSRVDLQPLANGDIIRAGETEIAFVDDAAAGRGLSGKTIGGYKIMDRLGRGAMGTVYRANQLSLNRIVALKILSHKYGDDATFVKQFQDEARAAGRLNHPNIVQVYDVGCDQGLHFFSMEIIENGSVQDLATRTGSLDIDLAVGIITDAARGLVYAEKKGLVHRDIKPDNLMINAEGVVKIADLGLALDAGDRARGEGGAAGSDAPVFGTPHFISPEQILGETVDTRSDIYSLGATFYRLITGNTPFTGENAADIITKQLHEQPRPVRDVRADSPATVAAIVERMLKKAPADRFQTAQALLEALEALDAPPASGRGKLIAAALVVVVLGAGAFFALRPKPAPPVVPLPETAPTTRDDSAARDAAVMLADAAAISASGAAQMFDARSVAGGSPDWDAIVQHHQAVIDQFAGTKAALDASKRVTEIRGMQAESRRAADSRRAAAESRAAEVRGQQDTAIVVARRHAEADHFGDATIALAEAAKRLTAGDERAPLTAELDALKHRAESRATAVITAAAADEAGGRGADAAQQLDAAATSFAPSGAGAAGGAIEPLVAKLRAAAEATRQRVDEAGRAAALADERTVFELRKAVTALFARSFDPEAALGLIDDATKTIKSPSPALQLAPERAAVEAAAHLRDRFVEQLRARLTKDPKVRLPGPTDRKKLVDAVVTAVDARGLTTKKGATDVAVTFASLTGPEAFDCLLHETSDKVEAARADSIETLLLIGRAERAVELAAAGTEADVIARARREQAAWSLLQEVRDLAARAATDDSVAGRLLRAVNRLLDEYGDTRASALGRRDPPSSRPAPRAESRG